jgi:hypothetical protein
MSDTTTCAEPEPILIYCAGRRDRPEVALRVMEAVRKRGWVAPDWVKIWDLYIHQDLRKADALAANKRALDESSGGILISPARENGCAEAAYLAGRGLPVVAWLSDGKPIGSEHEQVYEIIGQWSSNDLDKCLGWLAELIKGDKRPGQ